MNVDLLVSRVVCGILAGSSLLGLAKPARVVGEERYRWRNVAVVAGGFVSGIQFHPLQKGLAYARTDIGGAYRWDDHRQRWIPLLDWLTKPDWNLYGIESIGLDPSDPKRLFLACGTYTNQWGNDGAILRSDNQGRTFQRTDLPFKLGGNEDGRSMGERLAVDPNDGRVIYFGTRNNGLWKSTDRGITWSQVASFPVTGRTNGIGVVNVAFDTASGGKGHGSQRIYIGVASHSEPLVKSEDGGATWSSVEGAPSGLYPHHMCLTKDGTLYLTESNAPGPNGISDGAVWKLDTKSGQWTDISPVKPHNGTEEGFGFAGLSVEPRDSQTLVVTTLDRWKPGDDVFQTHDGGKTWAGLRAKSTRDASLAPYMSWGRQAPEFGWWIGAVAQDPFNPAHVLYGTGANIWGSDDVAANEPTHWSVRGLGIEETADIDLLSPESGPHLISALGDIGGFTHVDLDRPASGMTLNPQFDNTDGLDTADSAPSEVVRVGRPNRSQPSGGYSLDAGITWQPFKTLPGGNGGSVALSADGKTVLWAPQGRQTYWSTDWGATWTPSKGAPNGIRLISDRVNPKKVYALTRSGDFFASTDGGAIFSAAGGANFTDHHGYPRAVPGQEGDLWIPTDSGLFRTVNSGESFAKLEGVDLAEGIGFGKAAPGKSYPTIFLNGKIQGQYGVFRSDDEGATWVVITDKDHEYGTRGVVIGDPRIYGRVYMGTNGRGVFYADPAR
ncbi:MAG TPA: xyloglucanase [Fimbriimonas sp.]|nr:xyloglucanase [Fimbriimonas sp.]